MPPILLWLFWAQHVSFYIWLKKYIANAGDYSEKQCFGADKLLYQIGAITFGATCMHSSESLWAEQYECSALALCRGMIQSQVHGSESSVCIQSLHTHLGVQNLQFPYHHNTVTVERKAYGDPLIKMITLILKYINTIFLITWKKSEQRVIELLKIASDEFWKMTKT